MNEFSVSAMYSFNFGHLNNTIVDLIRFINSKFKVISDHDNEAQYCSYQIHKSCV